MRLLIRYGILQEKSEGRNETGNRKHAHDGAEAKSALEKVGARHRSHHAANAARSKHPRNTGCSSMRRIKFGRDHRHGNLRTVQAGTGDEYQHANEQYVAGKLSNAPK